MKSLQLTLFGGLNISDSGNRTIRIAQSKAALLFAFLALQAGVFLSREKLIGLLWSDRGEPQARASLRHSIWALRKALEGIEPSPLVIEADYLALDPAHFEADTLQFETLLAEGTPNALKDAIELYRGEFLEGVRIRDPAFQKQVDWERQRLQECAVDACLRLLRHQAKSGAKDEVTAKRLLMIDPLQEAGHRVLMLHHAKNGQLGLALKQYQRCRDTLRQELNVAPDAETEQLLAKLRLENSGNPASIHEKSNGGRSSISGKQVRSPPEKPSFAVLPFEDMSSDLEPSPRLVGSKSGGMATRYRLAAVGAVFGAIVISSAWWWSLPPEFNAPEPKNPAFGISNKPSIAVLPFDNLSGRAEEKYFADGMADDIITDLSKLKKLFVIGRNTSFRYRGDVVDIKQIGRELGVQYVLEGSVRRVGDVVRINAQLIDGTNGAHIWAERYDGTVADIFALQDRITTQVVGQLKITLTLDEENRRNIKDTDNPKAYDAYLRGWQLYRQFTPKGFFEAIPNLERAIKLDPDFGRALATLASIYWLSYRKGIAWAKIVNPTQTAQESWVGARDNAESYLRLAIRNPTPLAYQTSSLIWADFRQYDNAVEVAEKAVALDPNAPEGQMAMAWALIFDGRSDAAISYAEAAIRLDPHFPANYRFALGTAQLMLKQYAAAEATLKSAYDLNPDEMEILAPLSIAYAETGKKEDAEATLKKYTDHWFTFSPQVETHMGFWPFKRESDIQLFGGGLVNAGLCCDDQLKTYIGKLRRGGTME